MRGRSRGLLLALASLALAAAAPAPPEPDMALGSPKARVTVIEYASLGCPHCGVWARDVFPAFEAKYIRTGRARFVLREMLNGDPDVSAAGFLTARCAGRRRYFQVVEALFAAQPQMAKDGDDLPSLVKAAASAGLTKAQVSACLSDRAALAALEARADRWSTAEHVDGTPTFDVGGKRLVGEQSLASLGAAIAAARARR